MQRLDGLSQYVDYDWTTKVTVLWHFCREHVVDTERLTWTTTVEFPIFSNLRNVVQIEQNGTSVKFTLRALIEQYVIFETHYERISCRERRHVVSNTLNAFQPLLDFLLVAKSRRKSFKSGNPDGRKAGSGIKTSVIVGMDYHRTTVSAMP